MDSSPENIQMVNKHPKRLSTSLVLREMPTKTTTRYYYILYQLSNALTNYPQIQHLKTTYIYYLRFYGSWIQAQHQWILYFRVSRKVSIKVLGGGGQGQSQMEASLGQDLMLSMVIGRIQLLEGYWTLSLSSLLDVS